jgi:hypothetical protein
MLKPFNPPVQFPQFDVVAIDQQLGNVPRLALVWALVQVDAIHDVTIMTDHVAPKL